VTAAVYGAPDKAFVRTVEDVVPKVIADLRQAMGNVTDRRKSPRLMAAFPVTLHAFHSDGSVDPAVTGRCRDVSAGGFGFTSAEPVGARYAYVEFGGVVATAGVAALVKLVRHQPPQPGSQGHVYGAQYRTDM
jgi:hypothetical protein